MKNVLLILTLLYGLPSFAADEAIAVNFHGEVYETACEIAPASVNQVINLNGAQGTDDIYNSDLDRTGKTSPWVRFDIQLINCPNVTKKITATFSGTPDGQYYKNNGDAKNVAIELQSTNGDVLGNGTRKSIDVDTQNRTATLALQTHAIATGAATTGNLETVIQVLFNYE